MNMPITMSEDLQPADMTPDAVLLARLQQEIADECSRTDIECKALPVLSTYPSPVYDVTQLEGGLVDRELREADARDVARAVRYLDLRGMLLRPFKDQPHYVSFGRDA